MIVREDDTYVCEDCYEDIPQPPHREAHTTVKHGTCADCGHVEQPKLDLLRGRINDAIVILRTVSPNDMQRAFDRQPYFGEPSAGLDGSLNDDLGTLRDAFDACVTKLTELGVDVEALIR